MKQFREKFYVLVILCISICKCCIYKPPNKVTNCQLTYSRDSLYVTDTAYQLINMNYFRFNYNRVNVQDTVEVFVDFILYSPDFKKMFCLTVLKVPPHNYVDETTFECKPLVGFRRNPSESWILYPPKIGTFLGFTNQKHALKIAHRQYFYKLNEQSTRIRNPKTLKWETAFYKNVGDPEFWNSILWQKGLQTPGLYIFQSKPQMLINPERDWYPEREKPNLSYPDSLLNLFGEMDMKVVEDSLFNDFDIPKFDCILNIAGRGL